MRPWIFVIAVIAAAPSLQGCCVGRCFDYEGGSADSTSGTVACGDESNFDVGYRIEGVTRDLATGASLAYDEAAGEAGLCVFAVDPTRALAGQDPDVVARSFVCADGSYVLQGIQAKPSLGLFVAIDDGGKLGCDYKGSSSVMLTANGLGPEYYEDLGDGGVIPDIEALSVSASYATALDEDLALVGYQGDDKTLEQSGFMAGFIFDSDVNPVSGATISCSTCDTNYYWDDVPKDGIFGSGTKPNTSTDAAADAMFMVPGAEITTYTISDGGKHTWEPKLYGSIPEYAVFIRLIAQ
jgi:hypothetical protein